jgi:pyruvate kinase
LDKLRASVADYNQACKENNEANMLSSAEVLHSNYEMLVRIVKPVTKEVDEFHKVLYMIYHHYGPNKNTKELSKAIDDLLMRADELKNCVLPKWATDKKDDFKKAADELYNSTSELQKLKNSKADEKQLEGEIEKVHTAYQKLEALFD